MTSAPSRFRIPALYGLLFLLATAPTITRAAGATTPVSVDAYGDYPIFGASWSPSISADGRYVAFASDASNLVLGDGNGRYEPDGPDWKLRGGTDVFLRDRQAGAGQFRRVSVASDGAEADGWSSFPRVSADGRAVAFWSAAGNLVPEDTNDSPDVFVHNLGNGETTRVSLDSEGREFGQRRFYRRPTAPAISAGGRFVAFSLPENTLYLHDRASHKTARIVGPASEFDTAELTPVHVTADGRQVFYRYDKFMFGGGIDVGQHQLRVHDRVTGEDSPLPIGRCEEASVSADGNTIVFREYQNLTSRKLFGHDRLTGKTTRFGRGASPTVSADGRYVAFVDSLGPKARLLVFDRSTGKIRRAGIDPRGRVVRAEFAGFDLSADGRFLAFSARYKTEYRMRMSETFEQVFVRDLGAR
jgi:Tol biopolymer transport system component